VCRLKYISFEGIWPGNTKLVFGQWLSKKLVFLKILFMLEYWFRLNEYFCCLLKTSFLPQAIAKHLIPIHKFVRNTDNFIDLKTALILLKINDRINPENYP